MEELIEKHKEYFFNILKKKKELLGKKARKLNVSCYRIYDKDIPELPFVIDIYEKYLHVSIVGRKENESSDEWILAMVQTISSALTVSFDNIFLKQRKVQKRGEQYQKIESKENFVTNIFENGLKFEINLTDYIDTGLFLDHRNSRDYIRQISENLDILNLFCYTGSFSVYALAGNANSVVSVDLNKNYLEWAKRNMRLNQIINPKNEVIQQDCISYLKTCKRKFDVIILDPPSFSSSKKMNGTFDVKRDHVDMLNACARLLNKKGIIFFSTNIKDFKLKKHDIENAIVRDVTLQNIPFDFEKRKPHKAYILERTNILR